MDVAPRPEVGHECPYCKPPRPRRGLHCDGCGKHLYRVRSADGVVFLVATIDGTRWCGKSRLDV